MRSPIMFGVFGIAMFAVGCTSWENVARERFSSDRSCPIEGVTAKARPDLSAYELTFGKSKPPADIADDPDRVAVWKKKNDQNKANWDHTPVIEVSGCKEKSFYTCGSDGKSGRRFCSAVSRVKPT